MGLLLLIVVLGVSLAINPQIKPSHTTPYLNLVDEKSRPAPNQEDIVQRLILFGDAGHSTRDPWQASMAAVADRASTDPDITAIVALGDNIYIMGYPIKEEGQEEWDEDQLESISFLDAQLEVAKRSGASLYLVPGNHDWYANELDSQAAHIARYAETHDAAVRFEPYEIDALPLPESVDRPGLSLVFLDSEWLLRAEGENHTLAMQTLDAELTRIRTAQPDNLIVVTAHHPLETNGPHGGYLADYSYWLIMNVLYAFTSAEDEDTFSDIYQRMIVSIKGVLSRYERVIYAAGHEHSLQVFRDGKESGPEYTLVSGAANSNKVSGVWHNEDTRFAMAREGFMELEITGDGVYLKVFTIDSNEPVAGFWLDI